MTSIHASIEIQGLDKLNNALRQLTQMERERFVDEALREVQELAFKRVKKYPPPPPGSRYVRTYRLRGSWRKLPVVVLSGYATATTRSEHLRYNIFVQERANQAAIHQGRWPTIQDISEDLEGESEEILANSMQAFLDRI